MNQKLSSMYQEVIRDRIYDIVIEMEADEEFSKQHDEVSETYNKLISKLTKEQASAFFDYDLARNKWVSSTSEYIYVSALQEQMKLSGDK